MLFLIEPRFYCASAYTLESPILSLTQLAFLSRMSPSSQTAATAQGRGSHFAQNSSACLLLCTYYDLFPYSSFHPPNYSVKLMPNPLESLLWYLSFFFNHLFFLVKHLSGIDSFSANFCTEVSFPFVHMVT